MRYFAKVKLVFADGSQEILSLLERNEAFSVVVVNELGHCHTPATGIEDPEYNLAWTTCCVCREQKVLKRLGVSTLPGPICKDCKTASEAQG